MFRPTPSPDRSEEGEERILHDGPSPGLAVAFHDRAQQQTPGHDRILDSNQAFSDNPGVTQVPQAQGNECFPQHNQPPQSLPTQPQTDPHTSVQTVPYHTYNQDILCFTASPPSNGAPQQLRNYINNVYKHPSTTLHNSNANIPHSDIPRGEWTVAFAPSILGDGIWLLAFAAPKDSQFVWCLWPEKVGSDQGILSYLAMMNDEGRFRREESMRVGTERHQLFYEMVQSVIWQYQNPHVPRTDASGEFRHVVQ